VEESADSAPSEALIPQRVQVGSPRDLPAMMWLVRGIRARLGAVAIVDGRGNL